MRIPLYHRATALALSLLLLSAQLAAAERATTPTEVHALNVTLLSTMLVGDLDGIGEWGFSALIEVDGRRLLLDTGMRPDTVLQNARLLKIDLWICEELMPGNAVRSS